MSTSLFRTMWSRTRRLLPGVVILLLALGLSLPTGAQANRQHTVQPGETLAVIARYYGVTWQQLATVNAIVNPNLIYVGQVLVIPTAAPAPTPTITYTVVRGDTLSTIAQRYNTTVDVLTSLNNITAGTILYPGVLLKVPQSTTTNPNPRPLPGSTRYSVGYGDTLFRIASYFGVNVYDLAEVNGILNLNRIYVGQSLVIPLP